MAKGLLYSDCTRCAALCCMALSFDRSEMFAIDKAAGVACPNLGVDHKCTIHTDLNARGFSGCVNYDCVGAGQRVTQEVFGGRSWRDDASLIAPMMEAFRAMRLVHEQLLLLQTVARLPLEQEQAARCTQLQDILRPEQGWSQETLAVFERGGVMREIKEFLVGLKGVVAQGE